MGTRVIIGTPFERAHFILETPTGTSRCPNGHMGLEVNFCSECGLAAMHLSHRTPTAALTQLAKAAGVSMRGWMDNFPAGFTPHKPSDGLHIGPMLITTSDDGDDQTGNLAFGCLVTETISFVQLTAMIERVGVEAAKYQLESPVALIFGHEYD